MRFNLGGKGPTAGIKRSIPLVALLLPAVMTAFGSIQGETSGGAAPPPYTAEITAEGEGTPGPYFREERSILRGTEQVWIDSTLQVPGEDYTFAPHGGIIFKRDVQQSSSVRIRFRRVPFDLKPRYAKAYPIVGTPPGKEARPSRKPPEPEDELAAIELGGSKTFSVSLGSGRDLTLDQALRLNISGKVGRGVEILAILSDQNTPIQPEGTTQSLEELDRVLVEIRSKNVLVTMGDYDLSYSSGDFGRYERKLEGAKVEASYAGFRSAAAGAISKGVFHTNTLPGAEGNQGPYQLRGKDGNPIIVVLAGTERVWIDGELQRRGEDYTIEYGNGQITFTGRRLITGDSRITVDFEYTDESYRRSLLSWFGSGKILEDKVEFSAAVIREADDRNTPLDMDFSDREREILKAAGDSLNLAWVPGADSLGSDSSGRFKGSYTALYNSLGNRYYKFLGAGNGPYRVRFSYVGEDLGSYRYIGGGAYSYVGEGAGDHLPRVYLKPPQSQRLISTGFRFHPSGSISIYGELALSNLDANTFSGSGDGDNAGKAFRAGTDISKELGIGDTDLGKLALRAGARHLEKDFRSLSRTEDIEKERRWGIGGSESESEESLSEFSISYGIPGSLKADLSYGKMKRSGFSSDMRRFGAFLSSKWLSEFSYSREKVKTERSGLTHGDIERENGKVELAFWKLKPFLRYSYESMTESSASFISGSRYNEKGVGFSSIGISAMAFSSSYVVREDSRIAEQNWEGSSSGITLKQRFALREWRSLSLSADLVHRERELPGTVSSTKTDLVELSSTYLPFKGSLRQELRFKVSSTQEAIKSKGYIYVGPGRGTYIWDDRNGDGTPQDEEYIPDPNGSYIPYVEDLGDLHPIAEMEASAGIKFDIGRLRGKAKDQFPRWEKLLNAISGSSSFGLENKVLRGSKLWMIRPPENESLRNMVSFLQDVHFFRYRRGFSARLRYRHTRSFDARFTGGINRLFLAERSLKVKFNPAKKFDVESDLAVVTKHQDLPSSIYRIASRSATLRTSRSIRRSGEISLQLSFQSDSEGSQDLRSTLVSAGPGLLLPFAGRGRVRANFKWSHVEVSPEGTTIPYQMSQGKKEGDSSDWNLQADYRISQYMTFSLSYNARKDPKRETLHYFRAELRAYF